MNPAHLEPVSQRENTLRSPVAPAAVNARKETCSKGHPFDEILPIKTRSKGYVRSCSICRKERNREKSRRWYHRQKGSQ